MAKNPEGRDPAYQQFLDQSRRPALRDEEETVATEEEIGWQKQYQVRQAIRAARHTVATKEQLQLLRKLGIPIPSKAMERSRLEYQRLHNS